MSLPSNLKQISLFFERLPGIGQKTANRLAFYLLRMPDQDLNDFAKAISNLKTKTKKCSICFNLTEEDVCEIDRDPKRDKGIITVVEDVMDLLSFETGNIYEGVYHVLHGRIDPLNRIGPEDIYIDALLQRVGNGLPARRTRRVGGEGGKPFSTKEIILATNPDMEGEATAMYIRNALNEIKKEKKLDVIITRLAYGLPIGANLEYADYMTLKKAIDGRNEF